MAKTPTNTAPEPLIPAEESVNLYFQDTRSDKVYNVQLVAEGTGYMIFYQNGPRGGTLQHGKKTDVPVDFATAKKAYDKVVREKTKGGYSPGTAGIAFVGTALQERATGIGLQLSNVISEEEAQARILDPNYVLQEKFDGHRRAVQAKSGERLGINLRGLSVPLTAEVDSALARVTGTAEVVLDGEQLGARLAVFDVLTFMGQDLRNRPYQERLKVLDAVRDVLAANGETGMFVATTAFTTTEKAALYAKLKEDHAEGGVFKRLDSLYVAGRPSTGGDHLKRKFTARDSFRVKSVHRTKRSVAVECVAPDNTWVDLGNCQIPANWDIPVPGTVVDVEYLYAFPGGSLFLPQYRGVRADVPESDCLLSKLKLKARAPADTEGDDDA